MVITRQAAEVGVDDCGTVGGHHAQPRPARKPASRPLFALVQTRPQALVLAVSDSRVDLEAEMAELNETWNRQDLRIECHHYEIQQVCLLQTARDPFLKMTEA